MSKPDENEKYFDPKEYHTITVGLETSKASGKKPVDLMATLLQNPDDSAARLEYFDKLKKDPAAVQQLIDAIKIPQLAKYKITLLTYCWESGADVSAHFSFFIDLAVNGDFQTSFEAITIIDSLDYLVPDVELSSAKQKVSASISSANPEKAPLLIQLSELLNTL